MNQESILQDQQDWHLRWLFRRMEEITERRAKGEREITVSLDWLEELLARDIGFAQSNAFLTRRLMDFANCAFPIPQRISPSHKLTVEEEIVSDIRNGRIL
jgi:hypothetical protein